MALDFVVQRRIGLAELEYLLLEQRLEEKRMVLGGL